MAAYTVHPSSFVDEGCEIGEGTKIWHFCHIMPRAKIGRSCTIGQNVVVSPDVGGVVRARAIAARLGVDLAIIDKRRPRAGVSEVMNVIGEVEGRDCLLVDDIVDSGGTLCNAAEALLKNGARSAGVYVTHGVFSGGAVARIGAAPIEMMTVTDSIQATEAVRVSRNIRQLTIAPLIAEAMKRISEESSVSSLFN